jgi:hypothetical protein
MEIVFWALVGLLVGTAFGMVWHLSELTLASTSGLSVAVIFGQHTCRPNHRVRDKNKEKPPNEHTK